MRSIDKEKKSRQSSAVKENDASKKLHIKMKHCFGIGYLEHTFDFTKGNVVTVYAHNGVGKSSFCKAMELYAEGCAEEIRDELYGERQKVPDIERMNNHSIASKICDHPEPRYTERFTPTQSTIEVADESGDVEPKCIKVFGRDFDRTFTADEMQQQLCWLLDKQKNAGVTNENNFLNLCTFLLKKRTAMPVWFLSREEKVSYNQTRTRFVCAVAKSDGEYEQKCSLEDFQKVASGGEKRVVNFLYFLGKLGEFEQSVKTEKTKFVILDDIADMFDSRNRMAMIEYLQSLAEVPSNICWIIFSHNYDFCRCLSNRLGLPRSNRLVATKRTENLKNIVTVSEDKYQKPENPFRYLRENVCEPKGFLALIPFVRQLIYFTRDVSHAKVKRDETILTRCLHYFCKRECEKDEPYTEDVTIDTITKIFGKYVDFREDKLTFNKNDTVYALLKDICETISLSVSGQISDLDENLNKTISGQQPSEVIPFDKGIVALEDKVVLAMGIRLSAEKFMLDAGASVEDISKNRTRELIKSFGKKNPGDLKMMHSLDCLVAVLPDFVHMNAFHYEPLIDLDGSELAEYYWYFKSVTETKKVPQK